MTTPLYQKVTKPTENKAEKEQEEFFLNLIIKTPNGTIPLGFKCGLGLTHLNNNKNNDKIAKTILSMLNNLASNLDKGQSTILEEEHSAFSKIKVELRRSGDNNPEDDTYSEEELLSALGL